MSEVPEKRGDLAVIAPEMIKADAEVIADAFDLEFDGWRAKDVAEDVIRAALAAKPKAPNEISKTRCLADRMPCRIR